MKTKLVKKKRWSDSDAGCDEKKELALLERIASAVEFMAAQQGHVSKPAKAAAAEAAAKESGV